MIPRICITSKVNGGAAVPATLTAILEAIHDPNTQRLCAEIASIMASDLPQKEKKNRAGELKKQLPALIPHAQSFTANRRVASQAIPSDVVLMDFDNLENPEQFYTQHVLPHKEELQLFFAAKTPSLLGIRTFSKRMPNETIEQAQARIARVMQVDEYDAVCKDLARASFIVPLSNILYMDQAAFFFDSEEQAAAAAVYPGHSAAGSHSEDGSTVASDPLPSESSAQPSTALPTTVLPTTYHGLELRDIVTQLISLLGGTPEFGERNTFYFSLVKYIRYITDFNAATILAILPDFGLSIDERQATIRSAINRPKKDNIPDIVTRALAAATAASDREEKEVERSSWAEVPPMPRLPRTLQVITRAMPAEFRAPAIVALLPILGTLATRCRFRYLDHAQHSFSFISCVSAPAATGKSFIRTPVNLLLTPIDEQDELEREKELEYKQALRANKNKQKQPEDPHACPRNNGINISVARLLQLHSYAEQKHLVAVAEEIDTLLKSERAGVWSQKSDIYRLSFDNGRYGQSYAQQDSISINVPIFYNLLVTGTPNGVYRFFSDVENGLVTRVGFATLPDMRFSQMPDFVPYSDKEREEIITTARWLDQQEGDLECPPVNRAIASWLEEKRLLAMAADSSAMDTLRKRAAVIGFRAGYLAHLMGMERTSFSASASAAFAVWVAEYVFRQQMLLFGDKFEDVARQQDCRMQLRGSVQSLLHQLPDTFTRTDLINLRAKSGQPTEVRMVISRWTASGFIERIDRNTYKKLK